ncbi:acyl-CoA carboxylase subunit epsilon [Luteococcus peritonei]|uniref:Acyl-CoA carboxylase subunit epsilon n=1 Tax=Luteococcus peritonei TaxID=88874 RepID=A0ABW4RX37_9ACTN
MAEPSTEQGVEEVAEPLRIEVVGGNPSDDEVGAVMAVLQAAMAAGAPAQKNDDRPLAGGWKSYTRTIRRQVMPGREAWRFSGRP